MSMRLRVLLDDETSAMTGETANIQNYANTEYGVFQVSSSGTATVILEGKMSEDFTEWVTIDTYANSGGGRVSLFPLMRARISSYSTGTVRAELAV